MNRARPLLVLSLLALFAVAARASDDQPVDDQPLTEPSMISAQTQGTFTRGPFAQRFLEQAGLLPSTEVTGADLVDPSVERATGLKDSTCYTMRMYKLKRTERLSDGETGVRGYTTCERASSYQYRSAVAHPRVPADPGKP